jgi:hypothetical protein
MAEMFNYKINYFRDADQRRSYKFKIATHAQTTSCLLTLILVSCSSIKQTTTKSPTIRYINTIEVPFNEEFKNTVIGGLSSIDYDIKNDLYYFISDDRSVYNDARFYTGKIILR